MLSGSLDTDFWKTVVLQLAQNDSAMSHSIVALGFLLENICVDPDSWPYSTEYRTEGAKARALIHYGAALNQTYSSRPKDDSIMIFSMASCILFTYIEMLSGNTRESTFLAAAGLKMLPPSLFSSAISQKRRQLATLLPIFLSIDTYITDLCRTHKPENPIRPFMIPTVKTIRREFVTLQEALVEFEKVANVCARMVDNANPADASMPTKSQCQELYQSWCNVFQRIPMAAYGTPSSLPDDDSVAFLHLRRLDLYLTLYGPSDDDPQSDWDAFHNTFKEWLSYAQAVEVFSNRKARLGISFSLTSTMILILMRFVMRCRHPGIRRSAIALLNVAHRVEGPLSAAISAKMLDRIVEVEEMGLGNVQDYSDIPESARLSKVLIWTTPSSSSHPIVIKVSYLRVLDKEKKERTFIRDICDTRTGQWVSSGT
ncbi:hypothetical protein BX600DRAFT_118204 [Xylariales sp. PMI_506]|nr:hypothetical protein BX600DRAFT_118204 [Xylariales sp. PMI_506]